MLNAGNDRSRTNAGVLEVSIKDDRPFFRQASLLLVLSVEVTTIPALQMLAKKFSNIGSKRLSGNRMPFQTTMMLQPNLGLC